MKVNHRFVACCAAMAVLVLFVSAANAANRTWIGGNNDWDGTNGYWMPSGEPGPGDIAIFNTSNSVDLANAAESIAGLTMSNGIGLNTNDNFLSVNGLIQLSGASTDLVVGGSNSVLTALHAVTVNSGADLTVAGGQMGVYGQSGVGLLDVNAGGELSGNGLILLADSVSAGIQLLDLDGTLTAHSTAAGDLLSLAFATLTVTVTDPDGVIDLDGNSGNSTINVLRNDTLAINGGVLDGAYSGTINLSAGATFSRNVAWSLDGTLNANTGGSTAATISGTAFTQSGGSINVDAGETLQISSSTFTTTNGTINNSGHIIFDSDTTNISGITFNMTGSTASLTVNPGDEVFIVSNDLELDGAGTATNVVTINNGGTLDLSLSGAADESFTGTIYLNAGTLEVTTSDNDWSLAGTVTVGANLPTSVIDGEEVTYSANTTILANTALAFNAQVVYDGSPTIAGSGLLIHNAAAAVDGTPSIEVGIFRANAPVTVNPGATLLVDVGHIFDPSDEHRNTFEINSGTLDVTVADGEWQLGTAGGASGAINFRQTTITPTLEGASALRVTQGTIDVDGGATIFVPIILEQTNSNYGTLRFVGDGGLASLAGHLQLRGGDIHDITDDPSVDTQLHLIGGMTVSGTAASGVFVDTFRWDLSPTTIEPGAYFGVYADNIEPTGPQKYDNLITINQGTLHVDLGNHASWIMNGYLDLNAGTVGGLNEVTPGGDAIEIGDDAGGNDTTLNVGGPGTSNINSFVQFNSDAYVYIESGATLVMNGGAYFRPVNGANNGVFGGGAGTWLLQGPVAFAEATTIYMPAGILGLVGGGKTVDAPVTISLGTMLSFNGSMSISEPGSLTVNLTNPNGEWTIGSGGTIDYFGDSPSGIFLAGSDINLHGTINIYGDGEIAARLDIGGTGSVVAHPFANLYLSGGSLSEPNTISGGAIDGPNPLFLRQNRALTGHGDISAGTFLETGAELRADGGFLNVYSGVLGVDGVVGTASDSGRLYVEDAWNTNQVDHVDLQGGALTGAQVTNDGVIQGFGTVNVNQLINNNRINANRGTLILDRFGTNNGYDWDGATGIGSLNAVSGDLEIRDDDAFLFTGTASASANRTVFANGFELEFEPGSTLSLADGARYRSTNGTDIGGAVTVTGGTASLEIDGTTVFENGSATMLAGDLRLENPVTVVQVGATFAGGGTLINAADRTLRLLDGANVDVLIENQGTLELGASPGQVQGVDFQQSVFGALEVELAGIGLNDIDRLTLTGQALLAGALNVSLLDGFSPSLGNAFTFVSAVGGIAGTFDTANLPVLAAGLSWSVRYNPSNAQLLVVQAIPGDFNGNGTVDAADYVVWRDGLGSSYTQADYDIWRAHFGQTAGGGAGATVESSRAAVPEPNAVLLLLCGVVGLGCRITRRGRRRQ